MKVGRDAQLLRDLASQPSLKRSRRVFVNRTLRLETIQYIGFDLDWTLADYNRRPLEELTFQLARKRLLDHHGYPESILQAEFRPEFPQRGLIVDKEAGTVLRMDRHRYVGQAYLGRHRLDRQELMQSYRYEPINPSSSRYYHVDTLFELPETNLFAEIIELARQDLGDNFPEFAQIFADVRASIDWVHAEGPLKAQIIADKERFLQRDPELCVALERLALGGRRLFILTNSDWDYAAELCSYLFDGSIPGVESWRQLFDLVLVRSRKPSFFRKEQPFITLDESGQELGEVDTPQWGGTYRFGNLEGLSQLFDCPGDHVLYVGDHIYGDIVSSKLESTWRTALIVRELEDELRKEQRLQRPIQKLTKLQSELVELGRQMDSLRDLLTLTHRLELEKTAAGQVSALESRLEAIRTRHRKVRNKVARIAGHIENTFDETWGSLFKQGNSKTLFASQLESYACLYTSRVSNFAAYGSNHYFRVVEDPMTHERK